MDFDNEWGSDYEYQDQNEDGKYDEIEAEIYEEWTRNLGPPPEIERVPSPFDAGEIYDPSDVAGEDEDGSHSDVEGSDGTFASKLEQAFSGTWQGCCFVSDVSLIGLRYLPSTP